MNVERGLIAGAHELATGEALRHLGVLAQDPHDQGLGEDEALAVLVPAHVGQVGVDSDSGVRDQRPRSRRPDEQLVPGPGGAGRLGHGQTHVHRGVDDVPVDVGLTKLVAGQRRLVTRAVGDDLELLVEQAALINRLQCPPHRLHVAGVERAVGVLQIDPEPDPLGQPVPVLHMTEDPLPADRVELGDPKALDVALGGEAELCLHGELDGQAVAIPAALALDVVAAHRLVAGEDVLEHAGEHVV